MLRGREREQAALQQLVEQARSGAGAALVLQGQPGVGKSALLADLTRDTADLVVVRTQGVESEAPLPFAALHRLLRPVMNHLEQVPVPQAEALRAAFGESSGDVGERHLVFLATLNLLSEAAQDRPVLVVVDDAHWLDDASAAALLFTARRLQGDAVAMLFAVREEESERFDSRDMPVLTVTGVDERRSRRHHQPSTWQTPVAPEVRAELLAATRGNPLGLVELTRALSADQLSGRDPLPHRLPVTKGVEAAFLDRYRRLPEPAQTLLLVAATDDAGRTSTIVRAAGALGADADALDVAETSGLLEVTDGTAGVASPAGPLRDLRRRHQRPTTSGTPRARRRTRRHPG